MRPSVSKAVIMESEGDMASKGTDPDESGGHQVLRVKLVSFNHVSSKLTIRLPWSRSSNILIAYYYLSTMHLSELLYGATNLAFLYPRPNYFLKTSLTFLKLTLTSWSFSKIFLIYLQLVIGCFVFSASIAVYCISSSWDAFILDCCLFSVSLACSLTNLLLRLDTRQGDIQYYLATSSRLSWLIK